MGTIDEKSDREVNPCCKVEFDADVEAELVEPREGGGLKVCGLNRSGADALKIKNKY